MNDVGSQLAKQSVQFQIDPQVLARPFVQHIDVDVRIRDPVAEFRVIGQTDDRMSVTLGWQTVNQVHQTVFQATHREMIDYMDNQRCGPGISSIGSPPPTA